MNSFFNSLSDYILIVSEKGNIEFGNKQVIKKLGVTKDEVEKMTISDIFSKDIEKNILEKRITKIKTNIKWKFGVLAKVTLYISYIDYSNKKLFLINIKESEAIDYCYIKQVLDNIPLLCSITNLDGEYMYTNKACNIETSRNPKQVTLVGSNISDYYDKESISRILAEDRNVASSKMARLYKRKRKKRDGSIQNIECYKIPLINEKGEVYFIGKVIKNITIKNKLQEALAEIYKELCNINEIKDQSYVGVDRVNDLKNNLSELLEAEGIIFWIYDEKKQLLKAEIKCGIYNKLKKDIYLKMTNERFNELNSYDDEIYNYEMAKIIKKANLNRDDFEKSTNINVYKIHFNNQIFGSASVIFKTDISQYLFRNDIEKIFNQMGLLIKNQMITDELREEFRKRKETEEELEEVLATAMDIMSITADGGKIIKVNDEASRIFGWTKEELCNMRWLDMMDSEEAEKCHGDMIGYIENVDNNVNSSVYKYKNKWGKTIWLEWRYKYNKEKELMFSTAKDISEYKKLEADRLEYEKALHMESIKNEFFANISHEFKTPLNIILGSMQVINLYISNGSLKVSGDVPFDKYRESIVQNSYRLLRLVNNLIDITKIDTGFYKLALENRNIISVIEDITMSVVEYMKDKGITLVFDTDVEEVITACDIEKIERIMLNLLSNAIKYVGEEGEINVVIKMGLGEIIVSVKDNGIGIPKEKLDNIFERFIQVDNVLTRKCEGSGIGLSLVKGLVDLHGGHITVNSDKDLGTEFIFTLPIKIVDNPVQYLENNSKSRIEKCNIEFSDIYK